MVKELLYFRWEKNCVLIFTPHNIKSKKYTLLKNCFMNFLLLLMIEHAGLLVFVFRQFHNQSSVFILSIKLFSKFNDFVLNLNMKISGRRRFDSTFNTLYYPLNPYFFTHHDI